MSSSRMPTWTLWPLASPQSIDLCGYFLSGPLDNVTKLLHRMWTNLFHLLPVLAAAKRFRLEAILTIEDRCVH